MRIMMFSVLHRVVSCHICTHFDAHSHHTKPGSHLCDKHNYKHKDSHTNDTHIKRKEPYPRIMLVLSFASSCAYLTGAGSYCVVNISTLKLKKHKKREISFFE